MKPTIRWTVARAAVEFGLDRKTLSKYLARGSTVPGEDGKYSTREIVAAIHGDLTGERLKKVKAERELLEMELGKQKRSLIPAEEVYKFLENCFVAVKMKILGSSLSEVEQDKILNDLASLRDADL